MLFHLCYDLGLVLGLFGGLGWNLVQSSFWGQTLKLCLDFDLQSGLGFGLEFGLGFGFIVWLEICFRVWFRVWLGV